MMNIPRWNIAKRKIGNAHVRALSVNAIMGDLRKSKNERLAEILLQEEKATDQHEESIRVLPFIS